MTDAPPANVKIYETLYVLENVLRELLIEHLTHLDGPMWYRRRLPQEAFARYRLGIADDRQTKWTKNIPHHPVYYLGFPDLRLTIEQKDNWAAAFKDIFPRTKELLTSDLTELEFIRNKTAHNRRASAEDLQIVEAAYAKLSSTLTPVRFRTLASRYTVATDIPADLNLLQREASLAVALAATGKPVRHLPQWKRAMSGNWWLDHDYLGSSIGHIMTLFKVLHAGVTNPESMPARSDLLHVLALTEPGQSRSRKMNSPRRGVENSSSTSFGP